MKHEVLVSRILCIAIVLTIGSFVVLSDVADGDHERNPSDTGAAFPVPTSGTASDLSLSPKDIKSGINGLVSWMMDVFENKDGDIGETIFITDRVEVSGGTYIIGNNNTYSFSDGGTIVVKSDGTLRLGDSFTISGDNASIRLEKGSTLIVFGAKIKMPMDLTLGVKGTLAQHFEVTGGIDSFSLNMNVKGSFDLDGTLSVGIWSVKCAAGSELEADIDFGIGLDASSAIGDIRDIIGHIFDPDIGVKITVKINRLWSSFSSLLLSSKVDVDSASVTLSSPLNTSSLVIEDVNVKKIVIDITNYLSSVHKIAANINNIYTTDEDGSKRFMITSFVLDIESLAETVFSVKLTSAILAVEFGDRVSFTVFSGMFSLGDCSIEADLDIRDGVDVFMQGPRITGIVTLPDNGMLIGTVDMPFRTYCHLTVGDKVDVSFAADEEAYITFFLMGDGMDIYPEKGYALQEFKSDRYVEYELGERGRSAVPKSLKGTYYAELGTMEYYLYVDEDVIKAHATEIVNLPVPEPVPGKKFFGWTDNMGLYTEQYEMPARDILLEQIWTDETYDATIDSGTYIIRTDCRAVLIQEAMMDDIKRLIESGKVDAVRMIMERAEVQLQKADILTVRGELAVTVFDAFADMMPERAKVIGNGEIFYIYLSDAEGPIKQTTGNVDLRVTLSGFNPAHNRIETYHMDDLGRLTELDCDYRFFSYQHDPEEPEHREADLTIHADSLPICIAYTSYFIETGVPLKTLLISLIPVILVGIVLMLITRRD